MAAAVELQDGEDLSLGVGLVGERGVALLPQELPGADERLRVGELPPHDVAPLVQSDGEVCGRAHNASERIAEEFLRGEITIQNRKRGFK